MWDSLAPVDKQRAEEYVAAGWWRSETFLDDLAVAARDRPDHPAIITYEGGEHARTLTYAELATMVARFAGALRSLGVGRGDVVMIYLPNRWVLTPLYLACNQIGAVSSPGFPMLSTRELRQVLESTGARVCITLDTFAGTDYATRLAELDVPTLEHRVVIGDAARVGAVDFQEVFVDTPWEQRLPDDGSDALGPDEPALVLHTSGTTGPMKGVVHSQNTMYACVRASAEPLGLAPDEVVLLPSVLTHMAGVTHAVYLPVHLGCTAVVMDSGDDMALMVTLIARHGGTFVYAAPGFVIGMLAAQRRAPVRTPTLRQIVSGSAPIAPQLIADVREAFGVPMRALWGMTENGAVTVTRLDDPDDWAAHSDGRPVPWMQVRIDTDPGEEAGRLYARGASQCLGYLNQRDLYESLLDDDGWFDTGDLARDDGRGGIRITGRRVDLITRANSLRVSTLDIEAVLQRHPHVVEAVLVGYPDPAVPGADLVCAVVIPGGGDTPTLAGLHDYLEAEGVARVLWPDRLQFVRILPKNALGKPLRHPLRQRLEIAASARS
jgi:cyclohexanecarboxylate-CoA ligase